MQFAFIRSTAASNVNRGEPGTVPRLYRIFLWNWAWAL